MGRIIGIDYGLANIGIAITDERRIIAQPVGKVRAANSPQQTAQLIAKAIAAYSNIDLIVVGLPLLLSGKSGEMAEKAKAFGAVLEKEFSLPVIFWDERLTSSQVDRMLKESDLSRKKRAQLSDQLSAVVILQNYLDSIY